MMASRQYQAWVDKARSVRTENAAVRHCAGITTAAVLPIEGCAS
jgi:hypothetical protein